MSNDLISRKALLENIDEHVAHAERHMWSVSEGCPITKLAMEVIEEQPTAYDIDKVVKELIDHAQECTNRITYETHSFVSLFDAIKIVKGGADNES